MRRFFIVTALLVAALAPALTIAADNTDDRIMDQVRKIGRAHV